jgi:hypothetical protein
MDAHDHHTNPAFMAALKLTMAACALFAIIAPIIVR